MSYCRNDGRESDVYVIRSHNGKLICYCDAPQNVFDNEEGMISHLVDHRERGDKVPERAFARLNDERLPHPTKVEQGLESFWSRLTPPREGQVE